MVSEALKTEHDQVLAAGNKLYEAFLRDHKGEVELVSAVAMLEMFHVELQIRSGILISRASDYTRFRCRYGVVLLAQTEELQPGSIYVCTDDPGQEIEPFYAGRWQAKDAVCFIGRIGGVGLDNWVGSGEKARTIAYSEVMLAKVELERLIPTKGNIVVTYPEHEGKIGNIYVPGHHSQRDAIATVTISGCPDIPAGSRVIPHEGSRLQKTNDNEYLYREEGIMALIHE